MNLLIKFAKNKLSSTMQQQLFYLNDWPIFQVVSSLKLQGTVNSVLHSKCKKLGLKTQSPIFKWEALIFNLNYFVFHKSNFNVKFRQHLKHPLKFSVNKETESDGGYVLFLYTWCYMYIPNTFNPVFYIAFSTTKTSL